MSSRGRSPGAKKQAAKPVATFSAALAAPAAAPKISVAARVCIFVEVWWTVFFAAGVVAMQCLVEPKQGWAWPPKLDLSGQQAKRVFSSHWFWACWIPMILGIILLRGVFKKHRINPVEQGMMLWWLTNACFFHVYCDILSGYYQVMPALTELYTEMTPQHNQTRWADARLHLDTTYFMEMTVEVPLALFVLFLYIRRHPARNFVETFAVAVQFAGTIIYYVPRVMKMERLNSWLCYFDCAFGFVWIAFPLHVLLRHFLTAKRASVAIKKS